MKINAFFFSALSFLLVSFACQLVEGNEVKGERLEWVDITFESGASYADWTSSNPALVGFSQNLTDPVLVDLLKFHLSLSELADSFLIFRHSDGTYAIRPVDKIKSIQLETQVEHYAIDKIEGQLFLLDKAFAGQLMEKAYPHVMDYYKFNEPLVLGILPYRAVKQDNDATLLRTGGGNCHPNCTALIITNDT